MNKMVKQTNSSSTGYQLLEPIENLKAFASTRPPLIVFMTCLGLFGLILMTLAFYIKDAELKKPTVSQDWNVFLESFSDLEFCIHNGSLPVSKMSSDMSTVSSADASTIETALPVSRGTVPNMDFTRNYSVSMLLAVHPTVDFVSIPHNLTSLNGFIYGSEVGLEGIAANERINFAMQLPFEWNSTNCAVPGQRSCNVVQIYTCVYFQASHYVFPTSSRHPQSCESLNDTGVEYHASILGHRATFLGSAAERDCKARTLIKINYKLDPTLTVLLSLSDRSVINLHLLHTSYFLFVMTITLLLYATIRGRPLKIKSPFSVPLSTGTTTEI